MPHAIPKISVIIPLFNTERYIGDCLDSVIRQTYPNIEIIVVDDGSTDGGLDIVATKLIRTGDRIIRQKNRGVSAARNIGMSRATGDFIHFIDADDKLADYDFYDRVMLAFNMESDIDIAVCGIRDEKYDDRAVVDYKNMRVYRKSNVKVRLSQVSRRPAVWHFVFRRSFLADHQLSFEVGRVTSQDVMFTIPAVFYARGVVTVPGASYWYRRTQTGAMRDPARAAAREKNKRVVWARAVKFAVDHRFFLGFRRSFWAWIKLKFFGIKPK